MLLLQGLSFVSAVVIDVDLLSPTFSFSGVLLVSVSDSSQPLPGGAKDSDLEGPIRPMSQALVGDALALLSAVFYALYVVLLKVRIKEESRIDMQLFFGFVGVFNVLMLWPIGVILHFAGVETFEMPSSQRAWIAVGINVRYMNTLLRIS